MDSQKNSFSKHLAQTHQLALATFVGSQPNVRIVNYCFAAERPDTLYFATDRENQKVKEFAENPAIAFTTIPLAEGTVAHIRSQNARVHKSQHSIYDIKHLFIASIPDYANTIEMIGQQLDVYEIQIEEAKVIGGFDQSYSVEFPTV